MTMSFLGRSRWARAANGLTVARSLSAPVLGSLVLVQNPWWVTFFVGLAAGFSDWLDGKLARRASPTKLGAFLDPLADKLVVLVGAWALVAIDRFSWIPVAIITVREVGIQLYRSYWSRRGLAIPARPSAKYKTFVQSLALLAAVFPPLDPYPWVADTLLWVAVAFTVYSGAQYLLDGRGALRTTGSR